MTWSVVWSYSTTRKNGTGIRMVNQVAMYTTNSV
eukprot:CAMPEP_0178440252 /NCGR_PEP_ID=MMETSP0689_2-20121128/36655_1 /TAXON_ID=160604 /ORGANISM="Amphidinium massartii, Strain CS-259" /LENGTH=33 /DNA_ID= /DNA_START= /DNA_END= /DNA_ORIENTATION=